ncbi:MAG: hypothetical protein ACI8ZM_002555 [Crocinitomix sp.]|jgi:hypothetical protein
MKLLAAFLFLCISTAGFSQLKVDKTSHDFGDVTSSSNRTVDFQIVNQYQFSIILSTFAFDFELNTAFMPISVEPGDTLLYRVRIKPNKKGAFDKTIPLSFYHFV